MNYKGSVIIDIPREIIHNEAGMAAIFEWSKNHGASSVMLREDPSGEIFIDMLNCTVPLEEMREGKILAYNAIFPQGILSEANYNISRHDSKFAAFVVDVMEQNKMNEEERIRLMDMSIWEFCEIFKTASEEAPKTFNLPRATVLSAPGKVNCPKCGHLGLTILEGELMCRACGTSFGDIDSMDTII